jgi:hypothetical protein
MATRETSKQAARRRAKTNPADDRAARPRRAKAPGAPAWQAPACEAAPSARRDDLVPSPLVAVDVLWAAVTSARTPRAEPRGEAPARTAAPGSEPTLPGPSSTDAQAPLRTCDAARLVALEPAPAAPTAPAALTAEPAPDPTARRRRVAERAYALAEASGFRVDPFHAWLRAERELGVASAPGR